MTFVSQHVHHIFHLVIFKIANQVSLLGAVTLAEIKLVIAMRDSWHDVKCGYKWLLMFFCFFFI